MSRKKLFFILGSLLLWAPFALGGTPIENDPQGFWGIPWGKSLAGRHDLKKIDTLPTFDIYSPATDNLQVEGIPVDKVKLYVLNDQFARALVHYKGELNHHSLLKSLESRFGKIDQAYGSMMRGLNQQYSWRGPETEITLTYHGYRERGVLTAESRILAPRFLDAFSDNAF